MNKELPCKVIAVLGLLAAASVAYAQEGCVDSPENPTAILGLLGAASAAAPWLSARWRSRRRLVGKSKDHSA